MSYREPLSVKGMLYAVGILFVLTLAYLTMTGKPVDAQACDEGESGVVCIDDPTTQPTEGGDDNTTTQPTEGGDTGTGDTGTIGGDTGTGDTGTTPPPEDNTSTPPEGDTTPPPEDNTTPPPPEDSLTTPTEGFDISGCSSMVDPVTGGRGYMCGDDYYMGTYTGGGYTPDGSCFAHNAGGFMCDGYHYTPLTPPDDSTTPPDDSTTPLPPGDTTTPPPGGTTTTPPPSDGTGGDCAGFEFLCEGIEEVNRTKEQIKWIADNWEAHNGALQFAQLPLVIPSGWIELGADTIKRGPLAPWIPGFDPWNEGRLTDTLKENLKEQRELKQATQDQPVQDQPVQDQPVRKQAAQDQSAQDQSAQDQPVQDQPVRKQAAQDQSAQDQPVQKQAAQDQRELKQAAK